MHPTRPRPTLDEPYPVGRGRGKPQVTPGVNPKVASTSGRELPPQKRSCRTVREPMAEKVRRELPASQGRRSAGGEGVLGFLGQDMAVDLGTANTLVYVRHAGIVLNEPSVVAINTMSGAVLAVGNEAKRMIGRTPSHIQAVRPLKDGVIADFEICEKMLRYFIHKVHQRRWVKPRMVICVPSGITGVEQRAVQEAAEYAGARK